MGERLTAEERTRLFDEIKAARAKLDADELVETLETNRALIGRCFKYRNSYSCPMEASDYWWLYLRIVGLGEDGDLRGVQFEVDCNGVAKFQPAARPFNLDGWTEIKPTEFHAQLREAINLADAAMRIGNEMRWPEPR